jgi:hypothetical protein
MGPKTYIISGNVALYIYLFHLFCLIPCHLDTSRMLKVDLDYMILMISHNYRVSKK